MKLKAEREATRGKGSGYILGQGGAGTCSCCRLDAGQWGSRAARTAGQEGCTGHMKEGARDTHGGRCTRHMEGNARDTWRRVHGTHGGDVRDTWRRVYGTHGGGCKGCSSKDVHVSLKMQQSIKQECRKAMIRLDF
ncbi:hypothetical protein E2C01_038628 [Portunus trituberculatus]|uniref:Uncharacterized protein n=1 Tax=Portunus trituberculatus TaxID=210409 RepID=A0A5B7FHB1_PORTR|nr:hypothetical protein [Portunus trituberculatus]